MIVKEEENRARIKLTGEDLAAAIRAYLHANSVNIEGDSLIFIDDKPLEIGPDEDMVSIFALAATHNGKRYGTGESEDGIKPIKQRPTSLERGMEMMKLPMDELPKLAREHAKELSGTVGMCMEVLLTAYCHYAEVVEGCEPTENYTADEATREWFASRS